MLGDGGQANLECCYGLACLDAIFTDWAKYRDTSACRTEPSLAIFQCTGRETPEFTTTQADVKIILHTWSSIRINYFHLEENLDSGLVTANNLHAVLWCTWSNKVLDSDQSNPGFHWVVPDGAQRVNQVRTKVFWSKALVQEVLSSGLFDYLLLSYFVVKLNVNVILYI